MKVSVIVNSKAGKGRTYQKWPQIEEALNKTGWDIFPVFTNAKGHAGFLAQQAAHDRMDKIIVVGGDGSLNEVINGLGNTDIELGLIPTGTGNDFARSLGLSMDPLQAVIQLFSGQVRYIDLGQVNEKYFINACGIGIDAEVARHANNSPTFMSGHGAYLFGILKVLITLKPFPISLDLDGRIINKEVLLVAVGNSRYVGGGIKINPRAELDDGQLDICVVESLSRFQFVSNFPSVYQGKHLNHPKVTSYKAKNIGIYGNINIATHIDGEQNKHLPLKFSVLSQAIPIIMPGDN